MVQGVVAMLIPLLISRIFPPKIRLTGVAICYNVGQTVFAGLAPIIVATLLKNGCNIFLAPVLYISFTVILSLIGIMLLDKEY